ncbi:metalloregulator ArsR/SmtB family transcription factor [Neptunomonas phycophila]|uniref:metalloregulator ArsR/SmtB family transcription factor n=1 Tax=Neptunomonas phycophila TaxID=1572645 RepID=UPI0026E47226|nr:metalloregulator ArsR/SmtB family transcription factor [Neptunomonas phycophila]MDO6785488.1 metalloregulator ArsR/SmtB family transcription factor [Neptunomonas phycophila]
MTHSQATTTDVLTPLKLFKLLSDETRLTTLLLLREKGELCVCDITSALQQSQPKVSRHLAMLRESELLLDRREGKWIHYRLSPNIPAWAAQIIEQAWQCNYDDIKQLTLHAQSTSPTLGKSVCV